MLFSVNSASGQLSSVLFAEFSNHAPVRANSYLYLKLNKHHSLFWDNHLN